MEAYCLLMRLPARTAGPLIHRNARTLRRDSVIYANVVGLNTFRCSGTGGVFQGKMHY